MDFAAPNPSALKAADAFDHEAAAVVETFMKTYMTDVDIAVDNFLAEDCVYTLHMAETDAPVGGRTEGREAIRAALLNYHEIFEFIVFEGRTMSSVKGVVRQRLEFILRHRASNERWSGVGRFVWTVRDGRIVACEEYQDAAKLAAFFRFFEKP